MASVPFTNLGGERQLKANFLVLGNKIMVDTVLSISNENEFRPTSASFDEKIANFRFRRDIGDISDIYCSSYGEISRFLTKYHRGLSRFLTKYRRDFSFRPDENSPPINENSFRLNDNSPALNEISFLFLLCESSLVLVTPVRAVFT